MLKAYTYEEVLAFVRSNLTRIGTQVMNNASLEHKFAGVIAQMPPAWQVLFIENRETNIIADRVEANRLNRLYRINDRGPINGFFIPGRMQLDNVKAINPIVFHTDSRGEMGEVTATHEKGHRIDFTLGGKIYREPGHNYYSLLNRDWAEALYRELDWQTGKIVVSGAPDDILEWTADHLMAIVKLRAERELYRDYRPLTEHLSFYDTKNSRIIESFAEICNHYATLYTQTGGDESRIDIVLTGRYPELWSHFRDEVLPKIEEIAHELLEKREHRIEDYILHCADFNQKSRAGFGIADAKNEARMALAKGAFDDAINDINALSILFDDPIGHFARALKDLDDLYYEIDPDYALADELDDETAREKAHKALTDYTYEEFSRMYLEIQSERKALQKFCDAYAEMSKALSIGPDPREYFRLVERETNLAAKFQKIHDNGGAEAVDTHLATLPPREDILRYKTARQKELEMKGSLTGQKADRNSLKMDIAMEVCAAYQSGAYNPVAERTRRIVERNNDLSELRNKVRELERHISKHAGVSFAVPGYEIFERYERATSKRSDFGYIVLKNNLNVSEKYIRGYVHARQENYDWSEQIKRDGRHISLVRTADGYRLKYPASEFPRELSMSIARDVYDIIKRGGRTVLEAETKSLEKKTDIIRYRAEQDFILQSRSRSHGPRAARFR